MSSEQNKVYCQDLKRGLASMVRFTVHLLSFDGWFAVSHVISPHQVFESFPIIKHPSNFGHHLMKLVPKV